MRRALSAACLGAGLAACGGEVPPAGPLPAPEDPGARVLVARCGGCHGPPHPEAHEAANWPGVVARMEQHMVSRAETPLAPEERRLLLDYLRRHARRGP